MTREDFDGLQVGDRIVYRHSFYGECHGKVAATVHYTESVVLLLDMGDTLHVDAEDAGKIRREEGVRLTSCRPHGGSQAVRLA